MWVIAEGEDALTKPNSNKVLVKSGLPGEAVISSKRRRSKGILPSCMDKNQNKCDDQVNNYRHIAAEAIHGSINMPRSVHKDMKCGKIKSWDLQMDVEVLQSINGTFFMALGPSP